jgi:hypothetical protein
MNSTKKDGTGTSQEKNLSISDQPKELSQRHNKERQLAIGIRNERLVIYFDELITHIEFSKEDALKFVNAILEKVEKL